MAILNRIQSFFAGGSPSARVEPGLQIATPRTYTNTPAKPVNFDEAMTTSAWWAGCRLIAETIASLPIDFYRIDGDSRVKDNSHPLWEILNHKPNRYQTNVEFWETVVLNLVNSGNGYCVIDRTSRGRIISLLPLMSAQTTTELLNDGSIIHSHISQNTRVFSSENIWHTKLFGNGIIGLSPLAHARQSIGIALASEDRVSQMYKNGVKPTGVLMVDKVLSDKQRAQVRENFRELAEGNNDDLFVLEAGMKYQAVSMTPEDVELLASRRFQIEDIARFLGVPSVLMNDTQASTTWGSGIEQIVSGFYRLNLRPYLGRFETSINRHLLSVQDQRRYEIRFNFDELTKMDRKSRVEANSKAVGSGLETPNEARKREGLSPLSGGDKLYMNGTMVPIDGVTGQTNEQS